MARAPIQALVIPYRKTAHQGYEFATLLRANTSVWQFISGGAEDSETPEQAARREAFEEAAIPPERPFLRLDSIASVPRRAFPSATHWPRSLLVVPEYAFAVELSSLEIKLSAEHSALRWLSSEDADSLLTFDSNRVALWELNERLNGDPLLALAA
jgi:dATP pyrophosphohydrolase